MVIAETRLQLYWDHTRVVDEMADAYNCLFQVSIFQPRDGRAVQI